MTTHSPDLNRSSPASIIRSINVGVIALWSHPVSRIVAAAGAAGTSGLLIALVMPRGPVTTSHALLLMAAMVSGLFVWFKKSGWL